MSDKLLNLNLHTAIENRELEGLKSAIQAGADVNSIITQNGYTPLYSAVLMDFYSGVEALLKTPEILINKVDNKGNTPLHLAVTKENSEPLEKLLSFPGIDINIKNKNGNTPLHLAVIKENSEQVKKLLSLKSTVVLINVKNKEGDTALILAVACQNLEIVTLFLQKKRLNINIRNNKGYAALHIATSQGYPEIIKNLLEFPKIKINLRTKVNQDTALHIACRERHYTIAEFLAKNKNINVYLKNKTETEETACDIFLSNVSPLSKAYLLNPKIAEIFADIFLLEYISEENVPKTPQFLKLINAAIITEKELKYKLERCLTPKIKLKLKEDIRCLKIGDTKVEVGDTTISAPQLKIWQDVLSPNHTYQCFDLFFSLFSSTNQDDKHQTTAASLPASA